MSNVREVIDDVLGPVIEGIGRRNAVGASLEIALAKHFDITPKPVITEEELGIMVSRSIPEITPSRSRHIDAGKRMMAQLQSSGLRIVREDE